MNFRKLITYLTMGTAAAMPLAVAQNPTILQGNYISNVFGNSNFVLNPNAQTNVANVTNATRSTTTPLVATSEFTLSLASGANATWTLRAFDGGMKGQNCEARFTYRGFATATTKAEIVQNSLVVASLTLTPTTDPRIASVNFPCGDLVNATTFRIAQTTANMTGTNEIGGIYVGLATNMANVAQAEEVGTAVYQGGTSCGWTKTGGTGTYVSFPAAGGTCNWTSTGAVTPQTKLLKFDAILKPGKYQAILNATVGRGTTINNDPKFVLTDGTNYSGTAGPYQDSTTAMQAPATFMLNFEVTSTTSKTIELQTMLDNAGLEGKVIAYNDKYYVRFALYRFPSSSELVVTPERQNWFVAGTFSGANPNLGTANVSSLTEITDSGLTFTPAANSQPAATLCSSTNAPPALSTSSTTCAAGSESVGITYNIPSVGTYEVCAQGTVSVDLAANGYADTKFSIQETATNSSTATSNYSAPANVYIKTASSTVIDNKPFRVCQIISYSSIGQKAVRLMYQQVAGATINTNLLLMDSTQGRQFNWTVTPVTNQSNSALYVQGPVKAAETGAAISAGYVGEVKQATISASTNFTGSTYANFQTVTLTPGVWQCSSQARILPGTAVVPSLFEFLTCVANSTSASCDIPFDIQTFGNSKGAGLSTTFVHLQVGSMPITIRYDGTNFIYANGTTSASATGTIAQKLYLDTTSGTPQARGRLECVRIN